MKYMTNEDRSENDEEASMIRLVVDFGYRVKEEPSRFGRKDFIRKVCMYECICTYCIWHK